MLVFSAGGDGVRKSPEHPIAAGAEPADLPKPKIVVSIPDDSAEMVWQAAASLYTLGACLREGENSSGAMAEHPARCTASPIGFRSCYTPSGREEIAAGGICDKYDYDESFAHLAFGANFVHK